jgi:hypothetical protein
MWTHAEVLKTQPTLVVCDVERFDQAVLCMYAAACTLAGNGSVVVPLFVCRVCWCISAGSVQQVHKGEELRALGKPQWLCQQYSMDERA